MTADTQIAPSGLGYLLDRAAICDVMVRYATSVDNRDFAAVRSCFTEDAVATNFGPSELIGAEAIVGFIVNALQRFGVTQHLVGSHVIRINGDRASLATDLQATPTSSRPSLTVC